MSTIFVAVRKDTDVIMTGQKGQAAFHDKPTLGRSIGYSYQHEAKKKGVKASELYDVYEIDVSALLMYGYSEIIKFHDKR
ncbi:hypothetical protein [Halobacillus ihumii]|uniref:hypothetical protein n=1 Tax=Halobacillus ihumii TaxID=2686092 RepID=UPI0013D80124|nr:hypothetical protein [Halobacillus ihumii]